MANVLPFRRAATPDKQQAYCSIDGCENALSPRSRLTTCPTCRQGMSYWLKRRPAQIVDYRRKLTVRTARIESLIDYKADRKTRGIK